MGVIIKGGPSDSHSCLNDIGRGRYDGVYYRHEMAVGSIARCSCGRLWRARSYAYDSSKWEPANWFYRLIYRNEGWTDGNSN